jgi:hypothetical protein
MYSLTLLAKIIGTVAAVADLRLQFHNFLLDNEIRK